MSSAAGQWERFGAGLLSRASALLYNLLVVESLLLVTAAPGLAVLVLLDRDAGNLPLAALCLLPAGPALSAALYALHHRSTDLTSLQPAVAFVRGYRSNARGALRVWAIWLLWVTVLGVNLLHVQGAGLPGWWVLPPAVVAVGSTLWVLNALVITSLFAFRTRDVVRLAAYLMVRTPTVTLAHLCLLVVALGGVWVFSEAVLALAGSLLVLALLGDSRKLIAIVREEFTA